MNWQVKRIWLFSFLVLPLVFSSCVKPDKFGFDEDELQMNYVDTLSSSLNTVMLDTAQTNSFSKAIIGQYSDPIFGEIKAISYFQLRMPDGKAEDTLGLNPEFVSAQLILGDPESYKKSSEGYVYKFYMYQLQNEIDISKTLINDEVLFGSEDLVKETDRFSLKDDFGKVLYNNIIGATQAEFDATVKGIALVPDYNVTNAMFTYNLSNNSSTSTNYISIKYSFDKTDFNNIVVYRDTAVYNLLLDQKGKNGTFIQVNRSATELSTLVKTNDKLVASKSYIQGATGLKTIVEFPSFNNYFNAKKNVVFNKIEISVDVEEDALFSVPTYLNLLDAETESFLDQSSYNNQQYTFKDSFSQNLLYYFQTAYNNGAVPKLILSSENTTVKRAVMNQTNSPIKIKFYYTEFE